MAKEKKQTEQKKEGYQSGDALKGTVPDLNDVNFRNRDVMRWSDEYAAASSNRKQTPAQAQGLATFANRMKLPRYTKK